VRLRALAFVLVSCLVIAPGLGRTEEGGCSGGHVADGNDCDWRGTPTFISGASVISNGEFIYSDYVHDDTGANASTQAISTRATR
jgi:hypothetical protein